MGSLTDGVNHVSARQIMDGCIVGSSNVSSLNLGNKEQQFVKETALRNFHLPSRHHNGYASKKLLWEECFRCYGSVLDDQVLFSVVFAEIQLFIGGPIFQSFGSAVVLVKIISCQYRMQLLSSVQ